MTAVAVFYRFTEERLGQPGSEPRLLPPRRGLSTDSPRSGWACYGRGWLTRRIIKRYLDGRTYLRLKESAEIDNPDQRIAEDTRAFTTHDAVVHPSSS